MGDANRDAANATGEVRLAVAGMSCGGCAARVEGRLLALAGVARAEVNLGAGQAAVIYDPSRTNPARLAEALCSAGFDARVAS